jgi:endonuclease/exonuclease/phosphatase family metal-dependent hydrolase
MRLYTHNIYGHHAEWNRRRAVLAEGIARLDPDLMLLQKTMVRPGYDQVRELLGPAYHVVHSTTREEDGQGISIASRWPIRRTCELDFKAASERTGAFACTALLAEIEAPPPYGALLVANHYPDFQADHELERERQAVMLVRAIDKLLAQRTAHVLIGGDLDAEPDAASLRFLAGKQSLDGTSTCYRNTWDWLHPNDPGGTFVTRNPLAPRTWPFQRIDHIFIRCAGNGVPTLRPIRCDLIFDQPEQGIWASNHFGLIADVEPSPEWWLHR